MRRMPRSCVVAAVAIAGAVVSFLLMLNISFRFQVAPPYLPGVQANFPKIQIPQSPLPKCAPADTFKIWSELDALTLKYPESKLSGGIFLYKSQAVQLASTLRRIVEARKGRVVTVCETGFAAGHSAALFLSVDDNVRVVSFDRFERQYQNEAITHLTKSFGSDRFMAIKGDSCKSVPKFFSSPNHLQHMPVCDLLHGSSLCKTDNLDLVSAMPCANSTILTSTAMNSIMEGVYFGPFGQWRKLREEGCISDISCFKEDKNTIVNRNFVFAKNGTDVGNQVFCIALVTGSCFGGKITMPRDKNTSIKTLPHTELKCPLPRNIISNNCEHTRIKVPGEYQY